MSNQNHTLYFTWKSMKARCYRKSSANYKYYGAKGTTVAERWHSFENFIHDIDNHLENGHLLYSSEYELDKDLKGGNIYSLENCVVLSSEKNRKIGREKQKKTISVKRNEEELIFDSIAEASRQLNINRGSIQQYLKKGEVHTSGYYFQYL